MDKFEHDVFISYAHIDNTTLQKDQEGWIAMLHRALELRLAQLLGETPRIWRDQKLAGNDRFDNEILDRLLKAAAIVAVLSPRYVKSDWCTKEIEAFGDAAEKTSSTALGNKSRIFKVVKTPVPREEHPAAVRGLLGYEFFELDSAGRPQEFVRGFGLEPEPEFWAKLDDLAYDLTQLLSSLRENGGEAEAPEEDEAPAADGETIYLAETTSDLDAERDQVRRELLAHGHEVLPDQPLPLRGAGVEEVIASHLDRCRLSIHLVGSTYDIVPEGHDISLIELQARLAAERSRRSDLFRVVWIPPDREVADERQQQVIEALQNDPDLGPGDSVLETSLEDLKTEVHDKLRSAAPAAEEPAADATAEREPTSVYLIFDQADIDAVAPLEDYLYDQGLDVVVPLFDGDESDIVDEHWDSLHRCDAVLIYQGAAEEAWLRIKLRDLRKAPAGRDAPLAAKAVCLGPPETPQKKRYRSREVDEILRLGEEVDPGVLAGFLERLGAAEGEEGE